MQPVEEAYNWHNLSTLISLVDKNQVEVIDFKDLLHGKSEVLSEGKISLERTTNHNNKHKGKSINNAKNKASTQKITLNQDNLKYKASPQKMRTRTR